MSINIPSNKSNSINTPIDKEINKEQDNNSAKPLLNKRYEQACQLVIKGYKLHDAGIKTANHKITKESGYQWASMRRKDPVFMARLEYLKEKAEKLQGGADKDNDTSLFMPQLETHADFIQFYTAKALSGSTRDEQAIKAALKLAEYLGIDKQVAKENEKPSVTALMSYILSLETSGVDPARFYKDKGLKALCEAFCKAFDLYGVLAQDDECIAQFGKISEQKACTIPLSESDAGSPEPEEV